MENIQIGILLRALAGGGLIGLGAGLFMLANRRVMGLSGLLAHPLSRPDTLPALAGLPLGLLLARALGVEAPVSLDASPAVLAVAGLLVGFGTRLGNGCTSGHAVCGLARLSPRSLAATLVFMAVAALTVFLRRHLLGGA